MRQIKQGSAYIWCGRQDRLNQVSISPADIRDTAKTGKVVVRQYSSILRVALAGHRVAEQAAVLGVTKKIAPEATIRQRLLRS